ncbi:Hypothetical protein (Fragment) [Durusdinium trenchii]|uniref:Phospholipase/carboxylesterase/thioesterase domain-containing protein n=1 Tax=Durusdinium trenchii TaxID=1381693 RepID=A0ABP0M9F1_9DINO
MLHDVEVLGRSLVEALEPKLKQSGLGWKNVILCGFGKGAGVALYAALMKLIPQPVAFPGYLAERLGSMARDPKPVGILEDCITSWKETPLKSRPNVSCANTVDTVGPCTLELAVWVKSEGVCYWSYGAKSTAHTCQNCS